MKKEVAERMIKEYEPFARKIRELKEMRDIIKDLTAIVEKYGLESFLKANLLFQFEGDLKNIDSNKVDAINNTVDYFMSTDASTTLLNEEIVECYYDFL